MPNMSVLSAYIILCWRSRSAGELEWVSGSWVTKSVT